MTEFDKLTVEEVEAIGGADDPDAMERNARAAAHLWSAYEYAKNSFGTHFTELRRYWNGQAATRFAEEAQIVHTDVDEMGTVLQAHTDALPVVADAMRRFKADAKQLADEYRAKRAVQEKQPPETALPAIAELDREYGEKSRSRLIEANNTYHRYNNGYLAPPQEFRGVLPDSAQPQLQSGPNPSAPPPVTTGNLAPVPPPVTTNPVIPPSPMPVTGMPPRPVVGMPTRPVAGMPLRPATGVPPRPVVMPPARSLVGNTGPGIVRNPPTAMPRSTPVGSPPVSPRAVPRVGAASPIPAHPRPAMVRPVSMAATGPRPGVTVRPPTPGRGPVPSVPARAPVSPRALTSSQIATGRSLPAGRGVVPRVLNSTATATGRAVPAGTKAVVPPQRQWTRDPLVRAASVPTAAKASPAAPAPAAAPEPRWTRDPLARPSKAAAEPPRPPDPSRRAHWGRTPWVRPLAGSAVYPARVQASEPDPEPQVNPSESKEPLLNPVTLSRLLSEATPAERERLLAVETAKLERIRAARKTELDEVAAKDA